MRMQPEVDLEECTLLNTSQGGMCVQAPRPMPVGGEFEFVIDLAAPMAQTVVVKARVCWTATRDRRVAGLAFLESSRGWFGPD